MLPISTLRGHASEARRDKVIDVLYLYTSKAQNTGLNPSSVANAINSQLYQIDVGSGIYPTVKFRKAGVAALKGGVIEEIPGFIFRDVDALPVKSASKKLRTQYNADIVVVLTDANYTNKGGIIYGIAKDVEVSVADAYCIAEIETATMDFTTAHEIGHLIGGRHGTDATSSTAHAHTFTFTSPYGSFPKATVMASGGTSQTHSIIGYWSTPLKSFAGGYPLGVVAYSDMAKKTLDRACAISDFSKNLSLRLEPQSIHALGTGTGSPDPGKEVLLSPNPVRDRLALDVDLSPLSISIYSTEGHLVKFLDPLKTTHDVSSLRPGNYFVIAVTAETTHVRQILKL